MSDAGKGSKSMANAGSGADVPTLEVRRLSTHFFTRAGLVKAVDDVSFSLKAGEVMGLVGESGSGKSVTGFSILGLVDAPGRIVGGDIFLKGENLASCSEERRRSLRGAVMSAVFQDPLMTLNPVLKIGTQLIEAIMAHGKVDAKAARARAIDVLERVGIPSAAERLGSYPHQFSGGMRQRVCIAIALINDPALIIADEPTTALDVTIQAQILHEMKKLCADTGTSLIWITHDLSVVAGLADSICVMYAGKIVEKGSVDEVLDTPLHPYTAGLLRSLPAGARRGAVLFQIPGTTPSLLDPGEGCAFRERCSFADAVCAATPPESFRGSRSFRCFHPCEPVAREANP
jgi:peptide/nickel transport system ATP-binding protein